MTLMEWSVSVVRSESEFSSEIRLSRFISLEQWEFISLEQWEFIRCSIRSLAHARVTL